MGCDFYNPNRAAIAPFALALYGMVRVILCEFLSNIIFVLVIELGVEVGCFQMF